MSARQLTAGVLGAVVLACAGPVIAADLDYPPPSADYYGEQYERDYADRDYSPDGYGYGGSVKDGYPVPQPPPYVHRGGQYRADACLPPWRIKRELRREGWADIWPVETAGDVATVRARRTESGRPFVLKVDSCSGQVISARPRPLRAFGAYDPRPAFGAYDPRPWNPRWRRF